ncbi:TMV resistance protein N-like [Momordica charantia]|uniref:TMV resistance protein N-like n=1 Tax=Momordica charantia TaxID=3673 RepID=A0A6J1DR32_MOMCH|nr:TMV resistance protein N-like [Momordica charantia]
MIEEGSIGNRLVRVGPHGYVIYVWETKPCRIVQSQDNHRWNLGWCQKDVDQLEAVGTRIIITTRNEHLLKNFQVDAIRTIDEMNENEALELFSWHAFHNKYPSVDYCQLSKRVVSYCGGLPLALEVVGSFLYGRMVLEWEDALKKLKKIPHNKIQEKLKISFDGLDDQKIKDIFPDISCFFIGMDKDKVTQILDGCGVFPRIGISILLERCLLKVDNKNKFMMHNLLRDMGREIVRNESPKEPEKRSRIFVNNDVLVVLEKQKVRDLSCFSCESNASCISLNKLPETLSKLKSVETLVISGCSNLESLPKDLGEMESLTTLEANETRIELLSSIVKVKKLKRLSLNGCKGPLSKPRWSWIFSSYLLSSSVVLPTSLQGLESLKILCLKNCNLSDDAIPNDIGSLVSLEKLDLGGNDFHALPSSISCLPKLTELWLERCSNLERISNLPPNLKRIYARFCKALESISYSSYMFYLHVRSCPKLVEISLVREFVRLPNIPTIEMNSCHAKLHQYILERILGEINQGIKLHTFVNEDDIWESSWSLYHKASQIADFDFEGYIFNVPFNIMEVYGDNPRTKWIIEDLPKVKDGANGMIHTIGKTCFDLNRRSSDRCIIIRKNRVSTSKYALWIKCIRFNFGCRAWFNEAIIRVT